MPYVGVSLPVSRAYARESYSAVERVPRSWSFRYNPITSPLPPDFPLSLRESTGSIVVLRMARGRVWYRRKRYKRSNFAAVIRREERGGGGGATLVYKQPISNLTGSVRGRENERETRSFTLNPFRIFLLASNRYNSAIYYNPAHTNVHTCVNARTRENGEFKARRSS